ncbi:MAG: ATP-dependent RecD-like DNA helicase [Thermodesulfobacteriota bacterium]|nr:ATP-dependent RecD-like DNA helicase [Thermodesulfobacteriota bacterium]
MNRSLPKTTVKGCLEKITYHNKENHYTIAKLKISDIQSPVTVLGYMPDPNLGETLKIAGTWETHPRYGQQLKIDSFEVVLPATTEGIKKYLTSGFIKGIGARTASRLVNHFAGKTLEVIENNPERLVEVKGVGKAAANKISVAWKEHHLIRRLIHFLQENGIKTSFGAKIYKLYGQEAMDIICGDPFRLVNDFPQTGFFMADAIMQNSGMPIDETKRARGAVMHLLQQFLAEGNTFVYKDQLISNCENHFNIRPDVTVESLKNLALSGEVVIEKLNNDTGTEAVFLKPLHQAETGIADKIHALLSIPTPFSGLDSAEITREVLKKLAIKLSSEQLAALEGILSHRMAVITGGPGTGKTTLIKSISALFDALGKSMCLAAPTGRAARRISEVTGRKAETIHKLLGYNPANGFFEKNRDNPVDADALVIDEASMIDTFLMFHLLQAIHMQSMLILVGDAFQLPSVGPGNIFSDIIQSKKVETFELKKIYRHAKESPIITNAHKIRQGQPPDLEKAGDPEELSEFYFIEQNNPGVVATTIAELCERKIPQCFGFDPLDEIQVLTPMHKGLAGTLNLNHVLQQRLNPNKMMIETMGHTFKLGDKIMHLKNNYQKEVFNGDIGTICDIDKKAQMLSVNFYGRVVDYEFSEMDEISLAYAISVHKSQGSEYPAVIVPILMQHFVLLQRNLLYTALTRGRKLVVIIGSRKAILTALKNDSPQKRLSMLADRLMAS